MCLSGLHTVSPLEEAEALTFSILMDATSTRVHARTHTHTQGWEITHLGLLNLWSLSHLLHFHIFTCVPQECLWTICYLLVSLPVLISQPCMEWYMAPNAESPLGDASGATFSDLEYRRHQIGWLLMFASWNRREFFFFFPCRFYANLLSFSQSKGLF